MSLAQDVLVDPAQLAFDQASRDPLDVLTEGEQSEAEKLIAEGNAATTVAAAAVVIGGAFLLYRQFMQRRLIRAANPSTTRVLLQTSSDYYWRQFFPSWLLLTGGALQGAAGSMLDTRSGNIPEEILYALGQDYAERLGTYMHESSKEVLLDGFSANLNKRLPRQMAAKKAIEAFGLSQRQMRALQATKTPPPINSVQPLNPDVRSQAYIDQALATRAKQIGDQEAFSVAQEGRQLGWLYQIAKGTLPEDSKRMWVTARDERVCKSCGPMHKKLVPVTQPFDTPLGKMWSPSLHPNCRCEMVLKVPVTEDAFIRKDLEGVKLALFNREHPRVSDGRFATKTDTPVVPKVERLTVPKVERPTIARVERVPKVKAQVETAGPKVESAQITMPRVEAAQLVQAVLETRTAAPRVVTVPKAVPKTQAPPRTKTTFSHKMRLPHDVFLVAEDAAEYGDGHDFYFPSTNFTTERDLNREIGEAYKDRLDYEVEKIMSTGGNVVVFGNEDTGETERMVLSEGDVRGALEAELYGDANSPLRLYAHRLGFNRYEHAVNVFVVSEINTDENDGDVHAYRDNDEWEINGAYTFRENGVIDQQGPPIRYIWVDPDVPEDEELD